MIPTLDARSGLLIANLVPPAYEFPTYEFLTEELQDRDGLRFITKFGILPGPGHHPEFGECFMWQEGHDGTGYGAFNHKDDKGVWRTVQAHLWLYRRLNGPVQDGYELDHVCHEPTLCRPENPRDCPHRSCVRHVVPKTVAENRLRSLSLPGINSRKTHCAGEFAPRDPITNEIIGHDWSIEANVYRVPGTNTIRCEACRVQARKKRNKTNRRVGNPELLRRMRKKRATT